MVIIAESELRRGEEVRKDCAGHKWVASEESHEAVNVSPATMTGDHNTRTNRYLDDTGLQTQETRPGAPTQVRALLRVQDQTPCA